MLFTKSRRPARKSNHTQAGALRHALRRLGRAELAIITGGVGFAPEYTPLKKGDGKQSTP